MQRLSAITHVWFGLFRVLSPLLTESRLFSFPVGTEMFSLPHVPLLPYVFRQRSPDITPVSFEFPYSEIPGSKLAFQLPRLIAGYNVLHRLLVPRHPPTALSSLLLLQDARVHCEVLKMRAAAGRQGVGLGPLEGQLPMRPNPQDPTACLGFRAIYVEVPLLQGSTDDVSDEEGLLVNVPQSGACSAPVESWRTERMDRSSDLPNGSLERR